MHRVKLESGPTESSPRTLDGVWVHVVEALAISRPWTEGGGEFDRVKAGLREFGQSLVPGWIVKRYGTRGKVHVAVSQAAGPRSGT